MRRVFIIAVFLIAAISSRQPAAAQTPPAATDPLRHGHALLIGNSNYVSWPRLDDVPLQLDELAAGLKSHFDTVEVVKNLKIEPLRQKINGFLRSYGNDSNARLFIYYAGHGYTEPILQYNENRGYITGIDTPSVDGSQRAWDAARPSAMSMMEIRLPLAEVLAKHILVVFDSCFAGTIFLAREGNAAPRELTPDVVARLMEKPSRDIITAGRANERVPAHSPIPKLLLAAVNGAADPSKHGVISAAEINIYLRSQLLNLRDVNLTPQQGRLLDPNFAEGEFLFRVPNAGDATDSAAQAWAAVNNTTSIAMLEQFRALYPRSVQAPFAAARIEELAKKAQSAAVVPPVAPAVPPRPAPAQRAVVAPSVAPPTTLAPCGGGATTVSISSRCAAPLSAAAERALKPKDVFRECDNCPEMVVVPAGSFTMGSPASEPEHTNGEVQVSVTIARPFAVGKFAVTFAEWDACVADGGCKGYQPDDRRLRRAKLPVINVNWDDTKLYTDWLNAKTGKTYRLLSEAEREYVTRAGTTTPFWWGGAITPTQANYNGTADPYKGGGTKGEYRGQTVPVDSFEANPWGLFNVHGNVWEWTEDCWNGSNQGNPGNGSARTTGDCIRRVLRGGSWGYPPQDLRAALRFRYYSDDRGSALGFRLARTLNP
jgi:formylglycine-generating enzyme required for sulfatase activity